MDCQCDVNTPTTCQVEIHKCICKVKRGCKSTLHVCTCQMNRRCRTNNVHECICETNPAKCKSELHVCCGDIKDNCIAWNHKCICMIGGPTNPRCKYPHPACDIIDTSIFLSGIHKCSCLRSSSNCKAPFTSRHECICSVSLQKCRAEHKCTCPQLNCKSNTKIEDLSRSTLGVKVSLHKCICEINPSRCKFTYYTINEGHCNSSWCGYGGPTESCLCVRSVPRDHICVCNIFPGSCKSIHKKRKR